MRNEIELSKHKKYFTQTFLMSQGFSYYKISKFVDSGVLKKINKNNYENLEYIGEDNDLFSVNAYVSKGVICLMSAAVYYGLSTYRPSEIDVAIENKSWKLSLPEWPKIKLYYFEGNRYSFAVKRITDGENNFNIYEAEKTVCDLLIYRNKFGMEEPMEVLKNYLKTKDRDINKLIEYSEKLRCYNLLTKYLEVLL